LLLQIVGCPGTPPDNYVNQFRELKNIHRPSLTGFPLSFSRLSSSRRCPKKGGGQGHFIVGTCFIKNVENAGFCHYLFRAQPVSGEIQKNSEKLAALLRILG
jgi:hypothetical protein